MKSVGTSDSQNQASGQTTRQLKIVQLGPTLFKGGVANAVINLCEGLAKEGHQVSLICNGGQQIERLEKCGVRCHLISWSRNGRGLVYRALKVRKIIKAARPDIIHSHGRLPSLLCYMTGIRPDWFTLHNTTLTDKIGFFDTGIFRKIFSPLGKRIFVLDPRAKVYLESSLGILQKNIVTVPNGIDCDYFKPATEEERIIARSSFDVHKNQLLVAFVGRFHPQKHPELVIELAMSAKNKGANHRFVLIGEGDLEGNLRDIIKRYGLETSCSIRSWMDPKLIYQAADLLVMPSRYEGFPLVPAEAMAAGCPVLRSKTGGFDFMIKDKIDGYGCEPDGSDFIKIAIDLLENPDRLTAVASLARKAAIDRLSLKSQVDKVITSYLSQP